MPMDSWDGRGEHLFTKLAEILLRNNVSHIKVEFAQILQSIEGQTKIGDNSRAR